MAKSLGSGGSSHPQSVVTRLTFGSSAPIVYVNMSSHSYVIHDELPQSYSGYIPSWSGMVELPMSEASVGSDGAGHSLELPKVT